MRVSIVYLEPQLQLYSVKFPRIYSKGFCAYMYAFNLQATKLFIVTPATKGGGYHPPWISC